MLNQSVYISRDVHINVGGYKSLAIFIQSPY